MAVNTTKTLPTLLPFDADFADPVHCGCGLRGRSAADDHPIALDAARVPGAQYRVSLSPLILSDTPTSSPRARRLVESGRSTPEVAEVGDHPAAPADVA